MYEFFEFCFIAWKAYKQAKKSKTKIHYVGVSVAGVPSLCILVGIDRGAWQVSRAAVEAFNVVEE